MRYLLGRSVVASLTLAFSWGCSSSDSGTGGSTTSTSTTGSATTNATSDTATSTSDTSSASTGSGQGGAPTALLPCPTTGKGAIAALGPCVIFTPADAGADPSGVNAQENEYALEPLTAQGGLVVQLNGSGGHPSQQIAAPDKNIYNAAAESGFHVIGLSYRSDDVIGVLCNGMPNCYAPARKTVILGKLESGAPSVFSDIKVDEGIVARIEAALKLLNAAHPSAGWGDYLTGSTDADITKHIAWHKIIASGHSQGGGHAAFMGSLFPLKRGVFLSSPCDAVGATPAPWTDAANTWMTSPATDFVALAAPTMFSNGSPTSGDTLCPYHAAVWVNMGMDQSRMHDDAQVCGETGVTHDASIGCKDNYPAWLTLFQ